MPTGLQQIQRMVNMTYRIVKDGPSFLIALDSLDDPPLSIVESNEPAFITLEAAVKRRAQLEDAVVALANELNGPRKPAA